MLKYLKMYEDGLSSMRSLKRFMDWCEKNIKNKRDLEKMNRVYREFVEYYKECNRNYILFRNYIKENNL